MRIVRCRVRPGAVLDVAQQREVTGNKVAGPVGKFGLPARDPVEDQLGDDRVRAHHDQHRRRLAERGQAGLVAGVVLLVAAVQAAQRPFEHLGHHPALRPRTHVPGPQRAALGQRWLDVVPQSQVDQLLAGRVVVDGDAGDLHDAGLDGVHQREVADHPREDESLVVSRPLQVVRGGRQVVDHLDPCPAPQVAQAAEPDPGVTVAVQILAVRLAVRIRAACPGSSGAPRR